MSEYPPSIEKQEQVQREAAFLLSIGVNVRPSCPRCGQRLQRERGEGLDEFYCEQCGFCGGTEE